MAAVGSKVFVIGGEAFSPNKSEDHSIINVLDTSTSFDLFTAAILLTSLQNT